MENNNPAPLYRIWGIDNVAYGPVELPALIDWIKQERVTGETWVFLDQKHGWRKASELPELKICFKVKGDTTLTGRDRKGQAAVQRYYFNGRNSSATVSCSGTSGKKLSR